MRSVTFFRQPPCYNPYKSDWPCTVTGLAWKVRTFKTMSAAAGLTKASETPSVEVEKQDQLRINGFNRANNRKHELLDMIKKQKVCLLPTPIR